MRRNTAIFLVVFLGILAATRTHAATIEPNPQAIITAVNEIRLSHGITSLNANEALSNAARTKALEIARLGKLQHTETPSGVQWPQTQNTGYIFGRIGENLATNVMDPQELVNEWMNSPSHRANILDPEFVDIGVATVPGTFEGTIGSYTVMYAAFPKKENVSPAISNSSVNTSQKSSLISTTVAKVSPNTSIISSTLSPSIRPKTNNEQVAAIIRQIIALLQLLITMKS